MCQSPNNRLSPQASTLVVHRTTAHRNLTRWTLAVYESALKAFMEQCNKKHLDIGRTGKCVFSCLPYYR